MSDGTEEERYKKSSQDPGEQELAKACEILTLAANTDGAGRRMAMRVLSESDFFTPGRAEQVVAYLQAHKVPWYRQAGKHYHIVKTQQKAAPKEFALAFKDSFAYRTDAPIGDNLHRAYRALLWVEAQGGMPAHCLGSRRLMAHGLGIMMMSDDRQPVVPAAILMLLERLQCVRISLGATSITCVQGVSRESITNALERFQIEEIGDVLTPSSAKQNRALRDAYAKGQEEIMALRQERRDVRKLLELIPHLHKIASPALDEAVRQVNILLRRE